MQTIKPKCWKLNERIMTTNVYIAVVKEMVHLMVFLVSTDICQIYRRSCLMTEKILAKL